MVGSLKLRRNGEVVMLPLVLAFYEAGMSGRWICAVAMSADCAPCRLLCHGHAGDTREVRLSSTAAPQVQPSRNPKQVFLTRSAGQPTRRSAAPTVNGNANNTAGGKRRHKNKRLRPPSNLPLPNALLRTAWLKRRARNNVASVAETNTGTPGRCLPVHRAELANRQPSIKRPETIHTHKHKHKHATP